jgi:hypothetical protein
MVQISLPSYTTLTTEVNFVYILVEVIISL